jgi:WD40 repeat protein
LILGGDSYASGNTPIDAAEIYDETTGKFTATGRMISARISPVAVLLPNGNVLVVDGVGPGYQSTAAAEVYDYRTGVFSPTGSMSVARSGATVVRLQDGRVLVAGGATFTQYVNWLSSAEVYDFRTGTFAATGNLPVEADGASGVLLPDGRVLIAGGRIVTTSTASGNTKATNLAELYDPTTGTFQATGQLATARASAMPVLMPDGRVLLVGGYDGTGMANAIDSAELYVPESGNFTPGPPPASTEPVYSATLLQDGDVLVVGSQGAELCH